MQLNNLFDAINSVAKQPFKYYVDKSVSVSLSTAGVDFFKNYVKKGFVFRQFKSLEDAFEEKNRIKAKTPKEYYERQALEYVDDSKFDDYKSFTQYLNEPKPSFEKIKDVSDTFVKNIKTLINLGGLFKNDRIIITEDERGFFDFGLASLGLYRPVEFYSEELYKEILNGDIKNPFPNLEIGVVDGDYVKKEVLGGNSYFNYSVGGKKFSCDRRQKGATAVFKNFPEECYLKPNKDGINIPYRLDDTNKVFNGKGDIKLKYASSNKKSYLIYNKKDDSVKNVDIFVPINFLSSVKNGERAVILLPAFLIASALEEFGIQSRISALRLGSDNNTHISISIPVKDYNESSQESFDRVYSLLSLKSSASSFFAFHKIIAENDGIQATPTGSTYDSFEKVSYEKQAYMNQVMQMYKNWCEANKDKGFVNTKTINPNFQFAICSTDNTDIGDNLDYEDILGRLHEIFYSFYYYMDFLAIEMISITEFVRSIYNRLTSDQAFRKLYSVPTAKDEIKELIRSYVLTMLVQKYKAVSYGVYADTPEQTKKKQESFSQKVSALTEEINNL